MEDKDQIVQKILDFEWDMFQRVKSATPASCQSAPDTFRQVRGSIFQFWPLALKTAYLNELINARLTGRNLIREKYARMDNLIAPITVNPKIDHIVRIETLWQQDIKNKYPALYYRTCRSTEEMDGGKNFSVYLKCELETYGNEAIDLYFDWVQQANEKGINYSFNMLNLLILKSGFKTIEDAETFWAENLNGYK